MGRLRPQPQTVPASISAKSSIKPSRPAGGLVLHGTEVPQQTDAVGQSLPKRDVRVTSVHPLPAQVVDATQALNRSAGVANPRDLRGRSLSCRATLLSWAYEYTHRSVLFGKYCRSRPEKRSARLALETTLMTRCRSRLMLVRS